MWTKGWQVTLFALGCSLLVACGPSPTVWPTAVPTPSSSPPPTTVAHYPPPPTPPPPTATPTPTPPPPPLPALPLLEVAPAAEFDMEEVVLLGISQTEGLALLARLRSGETRVAPLDPQVVPAGARYQARWEAPYLFLAPTYQPADLSSAPLLVIDMAGKTLYRLEIPRGYWVGYPVLSPNRQQVVFNQVWQIGSEYGYEPTGPGWVVRVWDLARGEMRVLLHEYEDGSYLRPYGPVYWSSATGRVYLQWGVLESDAGPLGSAAISPDGSGWQEYEEGKGPLVFSPDGLSAVYMTYDAELEIGHTYYSAPIRYLPNQVWVMDLATGDSRLLIQEEDGAQYVGAFGWMTRGLLLGRIRAASPTTIKEWELLLVDPATAETSQVFWQEGEWPAPLGGPLSPQQDRVLLSNWEDHQYMVLDLASGQLQDITSLISGMYILFWCEGGTALIEQWGGQVSRIDLQTMSTEPLGAWTEVAFCR